MCWIVFDDCYNVVVCCLMFGFICVGLLVVVCCLMCWFALDVCVLCVDCRLLFGLRVGLCLLFVFTCWFVFDGWFNVLVR